MLSLALNFVLLGILVKRPMHSKTKSNAAIPADSQQKTEEKTAIKVVPPVKVRALGLKDWVDLLRNAGAPESLLTTLIQSDFDRRWQSRAADLQKKYENNEADINDIALMNIEHDSDLEREMENTLGEDGFKHWDEARQFSDINVAALDLTPAETDSLYQLRKRLQQQLRAAEIAKDKKEIDQAELDSRHEAAEVEYQQQLRLLLGYQRYNLAKGSGIPDDIKHTLKEMNVGQDQLAEVETIQDKSDDKQAELEQEVEAGELNEAGFQQQMQSLRDWQQQQMQSALGTNAFAYFQKQQDPRYVNMQSFAINWGLSDQDIEQVYGALNNYDRTVQDYQQQMNACQANGDTEKEDEIKQALQTFSVQTAQSLQQYLGPQRYQTLKQNRILPAKF